MTIVANAGWVTFPGINALESFSFVDTSGVAPAIGTIRFNVLGGLPAQDGDLVIFYNSQPVTTIRNVHIDAVDFEEGSGGFTATARFIDERWTWDKATISGKYNFPIPNNWIDPAHQQTPQQLAMLCFQALGVASFDVSRLPNDSRPETDWVSANPAQELEKICADLGCRVVPQRSSGSWVIWPTGVGNNLPDGYPYEMLGQGIDPKEVPDYIKIVSAPWRYQIFVPLLARAKGFDLSWQTLQNVAYSQNVTDVDGGFGAFPFDLKALFSKSVQFPDGTINAGSVRWTTPDGTKISAVELANDSVFRCWSPDFSTQSGAKKQNGDWYLSFPGIPLPVCVRQLILTDKLVQSYTDYLGVQHQRSSFIAGTFFGRLTDGASGLNYPAGTRIDKQWEQSKENMDERSSFSASFDPIDTTRSILTVSAPMVFQNPSGSPYPFSSATLQYCCAVNVRDPNTWQPVRYEYLYQIGSGTNQNFCKTMIRDDIQPWTIQNTVRTGPPYTTNLSQVQQQCLYYAQAAAREFITTLSGKRGYVGIFPVDMDGQIQQITYSIDGSGTTMRASQGTEHNWYTPNWDERRRQIARQNISERVAFNRYETQRREELKGHYNT